MGLEWKFSTMAVLEDIAPRESLTAELVTVKVQVAVRQNVKVIRRKNHLSVISYTKAGLVKGRVDIPHDVIAFLELNAKEMDRALVKKEE